MLQRYAFFSDDQPFEFLEDKVPDQITARFTLASKSQPLARPLHHQLPETAQAKAIEPQRFFAKESEAASPHQSGQSFAVRLTNEITSRQGGR